MIIGTSPNGVFIVNEKTGAIRWKLKGNFFGIAHDHYLEQTIVAERVDDGTILHSFKNINRQGSKIKFTEVLDVHQINCTSGIWGTHIILTDTKRNRIILYELPKKRITIGSISINTEEDIHHVNAVLKQPLWNSNFYVGLNNKGTSESQVMVINECEQSVDELITLKGIYHTHDLEPYQGDILISASHQGFVYSFNKKEPLFYTGDVWTRGLTVAPEGIWVGYSAVSPRSSRQDPNLKNSINLFSHHKFELIKSIEIPEVGQINDLIYIPKEEM